MPNQDHLVMNSSRISVWCRTCEEWIDGEVHLVGLVTHCAECCPECHPAAHEFTHAMPSGVVAGEQERLF